MLRFLILLCLLLPAVSGEAVILDRIVAEVNDEVITLSELKSLEVSLRKNDPAMLSGGGSPMDTDQLLDQLVDKKIKLQRAKALGIRVSDEAVETAIENILAQAGIKRDVLEDKLAGEGIPLVVYKEEIHDQIVLTRLVNEEIRSRIVILPEELRDHYARHENRYLVGAQKRLLRILKPIPPRVTDGEKHLLREQMEALREQILGGESFRTLATLHSEGPEGREGGELGYFSADELREELAGVVRQMNPGDLSPVLELREGLTLLMVDDARQATPRSFEEVQDEIQEAVYQEKLTERYAEWIRDLRDSAFIEIKK